MIRESPLKLMKIGLFDSLFSLSKTCISTVVLPPRMHRESTVGGTRTLVASVFCGKLASTALTQAFTQGASCTKLLGLTKIPGRVHAVMSKSLEATFSE